MTQTESFTTARLTMADRVEMNGAAFRVRLSRNGLGVVLTEIGGLGAVDYLKHSEVSKFIRCRAMVVRRNFYSEEEAIRRRKKQLDPDIIPRHIMYRARMLTKFLEEEAQGRRVRSDDSILEFYEDYSDSYDAQLPSPRGGQKKVQVETHHPGTPRNFMRLLNRFEEGGRSAFCLMYGGDPSEASPPRRRLPDRTNQFLDAEARKLASAKKPEIALHWQLMKQDNDARPDPVELPESIRTFYRRVAEQKRMLIDLGRDGTEATRDKYELSKTAQRKFRPLERIEMDEDKLDIVAMLKGTRLWNVIAPEVQEQIVLQRFWASVAIDCGTRSILALRLLDSDPKGRSAVETLHMAVMPKDEYAAAAGAQSTWIQHGIPEEVATDHGAAYLDDEFHECVVALCGSHLMPPTGTPRLRGRIERFFKTGKRWLRLFSGQTFSNPIVRGAYNAEANASMDFEELASCLVRLIVDAYHLTKHRGLGNQKPIDAWAQMTRDRPVNVLADPVLEGMIFGFRAGKRSISRSGIVCLGVPYWDAQLQVIIAHYEKAEVLIRVNPYDLGTLGFRMIGDDRVYWVKAAVPGFDGVSATEWAAIKRRLDETYSQHDIEDEKVIAKAFKDVMSVAKVSEDKHSVASHVVTKEDYERFERDLFNGYVAGGRTTPDYATYADALLIENLPDETAEDIGSHFEDDDEIAPPSHAEDERGSILAAPEGNFDPERFARLRDENGIAHPRTVPAPDKDKKPRKSKKKEESYRPTTISDLIRGAPASAREEKPKGRLAGRPPTFKSDWSNEDE
ncbi:putative transposase [Agrobacterium rubi TR3 = NBRC 13261]|uniref:Putative transposase n=1 Tax=Agrobacterium rubi TR3 = NBRC 13261 TaxID=1368415 RepID=A0A081D3D7_9HYPH|nr:DDE-type integrase/transposase/recombinase [Agrobacterium rubi]MBP1881623.1 putative transposase [Agrobacterium rubi]GAK73433.1 putative transposase [Agrobacterium rubi TR3 = NBRC 13261]